MMVLGAKVTVILACVGGAVYLASNGHEGWGWLVFLAALAML